MADAFALLKIHVIRGVNLVVRDVFNSDPYVVISMGAQIVKTSTIKRNLNPEWNEELTMSISEPVMPMRIEVFDEDTFSGPDHMGNIEFDIRPLANAVKAYDAHHGVNHHHHHHENTRIQPDNFNHLTRESIIRHANGWLVQDLHFRLQGVEHGELEIKLKTKPIHEGYVHVGHVHVGRVHVAHGHGGHGHSGHGHSGHTEQ